MWGRDPGIEENVSCQSIFLFHIQNGCTFLMVASEQGALSIVRELLQAGVDPNAVDNVSSEIVVGNIVSCVCNDHSLVGVSSGHWLESVDNEMSNSCGESRTNLSLISASLYVLC